SSNTLPGIDIENLAEEIEDSSRTEIRQTSSFLKQTLVHLIKLAVQPAAKSANHWAEEALVFQSDAPLAFSPGIRQHRPAEDGDGPACLPRGRRVRKRQPRMRPMKRRAALSGFRRARGCLRIRYPASARQPQDHGGGAT